MPDLEPEELCRIYEVLIERSGSGDSDAAVASAEFADVLAAFVEAEVDRMLR